MPSAIAMSPAGKLRSATVIVGNGCSWLLLRWFGSKVRTTISADDVQDNFTGTNIAKNGDGFSVA